jgi:hypothetical protein
VNELVISFEQFANSLGKGFIKPWKASGMIDTLIRAPYIVNDDARLSRYVEGCLLMEGFTHDGCDTITVWLYNELREED